MTTTRIGNDRGVYPWSECNGIGSPPGAAIFARVARQVVVLAQQLREQLREQLPQHRMKQQVAENLPLVHEVPHPMIQLQFPVIEVPDPGRLRRRLRPQPLPARPHFLPRQRVRYQRIPPHREILPRHPQILHQRRLRPLPNRLQTLAQLLISLVPLVPGSIRRSPPAAAFSNHGRSHLPTT